jgi:transcriptional regulator with XRE-family HTH domain
MNTTLVRQELLNSLKADPEYRHAWNLENVYTGICFQIRALREQRELSQSALGNAAKMAQERISILEDPNADTRPTLNTLLRLADALDVGLDVRFVPYGTVIDRSIRTDMKELEVLSFADELPELEREITSEPELGATKRRTRRKFRATGHPTTTIRRAGLSHKRRSLPSETRRKPLSREYAGAAPTANGVVGSEWEPGKFVSFQHGINAISHGLAAAHGNGNTVIPK